MLELPESYVYATQIRESLVGKIISNIEVLQTPHKFAFFKGNPMYIDNLNEQMGYIFSDEAGRFMSYLVDGENALNDKLFINSKLCKNHKLSLAHNLSKDNKLSIDNMTKIQEFCRPINGCNQGTISLKEIIEYVEKCTGKHAALAKDGDIAPYNGETEYSINTDLADSLGYHFGDMKQRIYGLLDYYISAELERKRTNEN